MKSSNIILALMSAAALASCAQQPVNEAEILLNDRAPHGNHGRESAAAIKSFILRILFPQEKE